MNHSDTERKLTPPSGGVVITSFEKALWEEIGEGARFQMGPLAGHGQEIFIWFERPRPDSTYPSTIDLQVALVQKGHEDEVELDGEQRTTLVDPIEYMQASTPDRTTLPPPPNIMYLTFQSLERLISSNPDRSAVRVLAVVEPVSFKVTTASPWRLWLHIAGVDGYRLLLPTDETIV